MIALLFVAPAIFMNYLLLDLYLSACWLDLIQGGPTATKILDELQSRFIIIIVED